MQWTDPSSSVPGPRDGEKGVSCNATAARCLWEDCSSCHQRFVSRKQKEKLLKAETLGAFSFGKLDHYPVKIQLVQCFCKLPRSFHIPPTGCSQHREGVLCSFEPTARPKDSRLILCWPFPRPSGCKLPVPRRQPRAGAPSHPSPSCPRALRGLGGARLLAGIHWLQLCAAEGEEKSEHPPRGGPSHIWRWDSPLLNPSLRSSGASRMEQNEVETPATWQRMTASAVRTQEVRQRDELFSLWLLLELLQLRQRHLRSPCYVR